MLNLSSHLANEIKTTMRYLYVLSNMAEIKSLDNTNCLQEGSDTKTLTVVGEWLNAIIGKTFWNFYWTYA